MRTTLFKATLAITIALSAPATSIAGSKCGEAISASSNAQQLRRQIAKLSSEVEGLNDQIAISEKARNDFAKWGGIQALTQLAELGATQTVSWASLADPTGFSRVGAAALRDAKVILKAAAVAKAGKDMIDGKPGSSVIGAASELAKKAHPGISALFSVTDLTTKSLTLAKDAADAYGDYAALTKRLGGLRARRAAAATKLSKLMSQAENAHVECKATTMDRAMELLDTANTSANAQLRAASGAVSSARVAVDTSSFRAKEAELALGLAGEVVQSASVRNGSHSPHPSDAETAASTSLQCGRRESFTRDGPYGPVTFEDVCVSIQ